MAYGLGLGYIGMGRLGMKGEGGNEELSWGSEKGGKRQRRNRREERRNL